MEILTFDFNDSFQSLEAFKQQAAAAFTQLVSASKSTGEAMSEKFYSFALDTTAASQTASLGTGKSFDAVFGALKLGLDSMLSSMVNTNTALCTQLESGFSEAWSRIGEETTVFLEELGTSFVTTYVGISESSVGLWTELDEGFTAAYNSIGENSAAFWSGLDGGFAARV